MISYSPSQMDAQQLRELVRNTLIIFGEQGIK